MKIHIIGIGGIGVSALAQYYLQQGHEISGSDLAPSELTDALAKKGMTILIGNTSEHIKPNINMVVYSPAVKPDNPEYKEAVRLGIAIKSYPEALGELTGQYTTIAVSGSHGKSTTTAMIALILIKASLDPTVIVGTKLKEFEPDASEASFAGSPVSGSNFRMGKSNYLVIEACEYDGSFLQYLPTIEVITNIDKEHLDYFKTFANVVAEFKKFIAKLPAAGFLVANKDDANLVKISKGTFATHYYSLKNPEAKKIKEILQVPGQHNISNALAALQVARILHIDDQVTFKALSEFTGTWRRFEIFDKKLINPSTLEAISYTLVSDYGHHPTEILATLKAAREKYGNKKIWCIFQPHQYQRTFYLLKDFVKVFRKAKIDNIIITDIYDVAGRETGEINAKVNSEILVRKIGRKNVQYMPTDEAEVFIKEHIKSGEVLVIMGAGNIYKIVDNF